MAKVDGDESAVVWTIAGVAQPGIVIPAASTGGTLRILSVTSNEPAGRKGEDWVIVDEDTVKLRASRSGSGTGRVYTITVEATDESGNTSTKRSEKRAVQRLMPGTPVQAMLKHRAGRSGAFYLRLSDSIPRGRDAKV